MEESEAELTQTTERCRDDTRGEAAPPLRLRDVVRVAVATTKEKFVADNPWPSLIVPDLEDTERSLITWATPEPERFRTMPGDGTSLELLRTVYSSAVVVSLLKTSKNPIERLFFVGRALNNDFVIRRQTISKSHAYFARRSGGEWIVQDTGSTNGLFVGGVRVPARTSRVLEDNVEIHFGAETLALFRLPAGLYDTARALARL